MTFKMFYDERNRTNIAKLADNTRLAALRWYQYCIDNKIDILIYETIRTKEKQLENVKNGKSQTMKSYHLVGQALDFSPVVDSKGNLGWSISNYTRKAVMDAINYAKKLGFTWGGDWDNDGEWRDETFLDSPHLQFTFRGYGTDTFGKIAISETDLKKGENVLNFENISSKALIDNLQKLLDSKKTQEMMIKKGVAEGAFNETWLHKWEKGEVSKEELIALSNLIAIKEWRA